MKDNLWNAVFTEYKKHGNSLNGAQLIMIEQNWREMQKNYTDVEIIGMLRSDFYTYHQISNVWRRK